MFTSKLYNHLMSAGLGIVLLGCSTQAAENKTDASSPPFRLPVDVKVVNYTPFNQDESVAGSILPNKQVAITSELAKKVSSIHFADGSFITKGQLLYKLEDGEIKARLKQVQAELALAKLSESRLSQLLKNESVRQEEYDVASTKLQSLQASEELLQIELSKTSITAPFAGSIGMTKVEVGSLVNPGSPLVDLQDQSVIKIQFTVSEKYLNSLSKGKRIYFSVANENERIPATISATEAGVDLQSRTMIVHAISPNSQGKMKGGMSARVYFSTVDEDAMALSLPTESLIPDAKGYSVFVVKNGLAKITPVTIGDRNEAEALITSGLHDGDTVMISNILRSGDGTPVQIISAK